MNSINILTGHKFGGILSAYKTLIPKLKKDFNINILTLDDYQKTNIIPNIQQINLGVKTPITGFRLLIFIYKFIVVSKKYNLDTFIINGPAIAILVYIASLVGKFNFFIYIPEPLSPVIKEKSSLAKKLYIFFLKKSFNKALAVICISKSVKENIKETLGINISKIIACPISVDSIVHLSKEKLEKEFDRTVFNFVTVGRLTKAKGFIGLIKAVNGIKNNTIKPFKVYIVGDGEEYNSLKISIEKLKLSAIIELTGYKENPYPYINNCDCYLSTSLWEGFGLTIVYAMILKKPIIASKTGGAIDLLKGANVFYDIGNVQELGNKMLEMMKAGALNKSVLELNFKNALQYDVSKIAKEFKCLINEKLAS